MVRQLESSAKDLAAQLREEQSKAASAMQAAGRQQVGLLCCKGKDLDS